MPRRHIPIGSDLELEAFIDEQDGGGGGSLPAWWTVDSTPGSESVEFAGAVTISPADAPGAFNLLADGSLELLLATFGGATAGAGDAGLTLFTPTDGYYLKTDDDEFTVSSLGAVTISPSDASVAVTVDSAGGAIAALEADALPITGVADPTNAQDAATKNYADTTFALVAAGVPDATGAASGDMLTADGIGGFAWVTP